MAVYKRKNTKSQHYFFKFTIDGETYKETVKSARTKAQAEEAERRARQDIHEGRYGRKGRNQLFATFVNEVYLKWAEQHHKAFDVDTRHARLLCEYFKGRSLGQITQLAIEGFKRERSRTITRFGTPRKPRSVNSELNVLSGILTMAVEHKLIRENPCGSIKRLEAEEGPCRRLLAEEELRLLASAEQEASFLKPMIQVAIWTGLRQGELIALKRGAIDFNHNRFFVVNPKWKKDKRKTEGNPMGEKVRRLLFELCQYLQNEHVFANKQGKVLTRYQVDGAFRRACRRAGITGLRFHDLRHEYGSRLGDMDVNLAKIARLMGHSTTRQTERYVHPNESGLLIATEIASRVANSELFQDRSRTAQEDRLRIVGSR